MDEQSTPPSESKEFPTVCEVCGKDTGTRSYYTHRALQHPELVPRMDWQKEIKKKKRRR
jgi:hypothetical protein